MKNLTLSEEAIIYLKCVVMHDSYGRLRTGEFQWDSEIAEICKQLKIEL